MDGEETSPEKQNELEDSPDLNGEMEGMDDMEGGESPGDMEGMDEGAMDGEEHKEEEEGANDDEEAAGSRHEGDPVDETGSRQGKSVHESENGEAKSRQSQRPDGEDGVEGDGEGEEEELKDPENDEARSHKEDGEPLVDGEEPKEKPAGPKPKKKVTAPVKHEPKKDLSKDNRLLWMINQLEEHLRINPEIVKPNHYQWLLDFLDNNDYRKVFFWIEYAGEVANLVVDYSTPENIYDMGVNLREFQICFFLKKSGDHKITFQNMQQSLMVGLCDGDPLDDILNKMNAEYLPKLLGEKNWPEGVKKEFVAQLHKFMAALTEASHATKGRTTLYIPNEELSDTEAAAKDKDLLQRLESTVIYWTRQIKEVVSNQDSQQSNESTSPIDEINHWKNRALNLNILKLQLQKPELKRIIQVLQNAGSSYLPGFRELEKKINEGHDEASDNLQFLTQLQEPCAKIEKSEPKDIPAILPAVLNSVRLIWELSKYYNTTERMQGLLTKISNQIIKRCRSKINKDDMLEGDVEKCMRDLDESIQCCKQWKTICLKMQGMIKKYSSRPNWTLDKNETIFAENEAFIQRCKDLNEICEGQLQFARKAANITMPIFGGTKGLELKANLLQLQSMFEKYLSNIKNLDYDILDVKNTKWHDDYGQIFKEQIKNLEIIYQNIIALAFKTISTVPDAIEMLENFDSLAKRPMVKDYVQKKAAEWVFKLFMDEIKEVEEQFDIGQQKKKPPMPCSHPKHGGMAIWTQSLIVRIDKSKNAIDMLYFIPEHPHSKEAYEKYQKLRSSLDTYIVQTCFGNWKKDIEPLEKNVQEKLNVPVLVRSENVLHDLPQSIATNPLFQRSKKNGLLESNFDSHLLKVLIEVTYWNKIQTLGYVNVPHYVAKLIGRKEELRVLRENIMLIVRDYNTIIYTINDKEKSLFKEHLDNLDRQIEPGIKKYNWDKSDDKFVIGCRRECQDVFKRVKMFQKNQMKISDEFEKISTTCYTQIQKKLYHLKEFIKEQEDSLKQKEKDFVKSFEKIKSKMMKTYDLFINKGAKIQTEWLSFVTRLDRNLEKSLKQSVKNTLMDLSKHIRGDIKQDIFVALLKVYTIIDTSDDGWRILHDPTHPELRTNIQNFILKIIQVTKIIPRIEKVFRDERDKKIATIKKTLDDQEKSMGGGKGGYGAGRGGMKNPNDVHYQNLTEEEKDEEWKKRWQLPKPYESKSEYQERISTNKNIKSTTTYILEGIENIQTNMEDDRKQWQVSEEFRQLYNIRSERGRKRILLGNKDQLDPDPVQRYKEAIESLNDVLNDVKNKHAQKQEQFIILDCSLLKNKLLDHGNEFIQTIFNYLIQESKDDLNSLLQEFNDTIDELKTPSLDLQHLKKNRDRYADVKNRLNMLDARRDPIKKKFQYIIDQGQESGLIELTEEDKMKLASLDEAWKKFQEDLDVAGSIIQKSYGSLKTEVDHTIEDFKKDVVDNKKKFTQEAPYGAERATDYNINQKDNQRAFDKLQEYKGITKELREKEEEMKFGLEIFDIDPMPYPELNSVEREIQLLTEVWTLKDQWDGQWNSWRTERFKEINIDAMDDEAREYLEKIKAFDKDAKAWPVFDVVKGNIENFLALMPIILELRDEAMRERHWKELRFEVKEDFDETSEEFTLEKVRGLKFIEIADKIAELADNARKELKIELQLNEIERMWKSDPNTDLDVIRLKSKANNEEYFKIQSSDNIYQIIEDHGVKLSNMKSSPYYKQFDILIDQWELDISLITETLELLLSVQGKWSYLESIFRGQQDISKLLPNESAVFEKIHTTFKAEMDRINKDRNALKSLKVKGFPITLQELNKKLEQIQKQLKQFLEAKRGLFPRFYFLSDDDLLEIIGQAKDLEPINKHIKKMFEGIALLNGPKTVTRQAVQYEINQIISPEKEEIEIKSIQLESKIETWLLKLLDAMKESLRKIFYKFYTDKMGAQKKGIGDLSKLIKNTPGQVLITCAQMQWTLEVTSALAQLEASQNVNALKKARQTYKKKVEQYIELVEKNPAYLERLKLISLITIEEHNREVIEKIYNQKISSPRHFEWLQQLRFRRANDENEQLFIQVDQTNCTFDYGYEYQGNNGRLVVTPLTDRAYMTLTNALNMQRGGAPQGPAGTGKTETVKDLGKNLAFFVVIQNCSDSMDYLSLGKIFAGLALSGSWGCFDEFNRIELEVLSVVAQQIQTILDCIKRGDQTTNFGEFGIIKVRKECGIFITMNPGYAGRTELPDNLKMLFRPVAMMVPDFNTIAKIILMSEGFKQNEPLAKKVVTIYDLMKKQLSKQDHYDFGMRALKSVLNAAGRVKRERPELDEFTVMIKAIRDMNLTKFIAEDVVLFDNLFIDLFPGCDEPENDCDDLLIAIEDSLKKKNLQLNENLVVKILQLYESKVTRHGNMVVGVTMSGKSRCWEILADALNILNSEEREKGTAPENIKYPAVKWEAINPKSITINELFGNFDESNPPQWHDGILSSVLKRICQEAKHDHRWMILDGPVDTLWIESMNSVLDDNKLLTLNNGDRIALSPNVRLLFEVENLAVASPATVSRAGMIYMDIEELGWKPLVEQWISLKQDENMRELLEELVKKYVQKVLNIKKAQCKELIPTSVSACTQNLCKLFDALCKNLIKSDDEDIDTFNLYIEKWFVFCLIWSIGATVEEVSRVEIDLILRDIESMFPHANTVFDYYINQDKKDWESWEARLPANWKPVGQDFHKINVPTIDTIRNRYIVQALLDAGSQVLIVGHSGVGKTVLVEGILQGFDTHIHCFSVNFSAGTTSENTQNIIESNFQKGAQNKHRPKQGKKKVVCFIDDLNMARKDTYGSQPPLELIRQYIDYSFWYDRAKIQQNHIFNLQILAAMGKPGGGRAEISKRLQSKFHVINYTVPTESQMKRIYETIVQHKFSNFEDEIKQLSEPLAMSTISLFNTIQEQFLPTPAKSHYVFNMRDISKVFQGIYLADKSFYEGKEHIIKLWSHELLRVFHDRLNSFEDRDILKGFLQEQLVSQFQMDYKENCQTNGEDAVFVDFLNENMKVLYEEVTNFDKLREYLNSKLEAYNATPKFIKMDLVLFRDAITNIAKIYRVLNLKRGHAFLVGVGGSGRHSLTRLSAFISDMNIYQLEVTKGFSLKNFREFIKELYEVSSFKSKGSYKTVFIFSDNDVVHESFLEDVNNILSSGLVPNLHTPDELSKIVEDSKRAFKKDGFTSDVPDLIKDHFFNKVKDNLHISLCMSPIGQAFRDYCRMYPALINNTTINWFMGWPEDALTEVALKFIGEVEVPPNLKVGLAKLCCYAHSTVIDGATQMLKELKRIFYVTPTNYIELLKGYKQILSVKRKEVGNQITKLRNGLSKLDDARKQVEEMTQESEIKRAEVSKQQKICEDLMINMSKEQRNADESQKNIELEKIKIGKEKEETEKLAADAEQELQKAYPALAAAQEAIESLDKKYIAEIKSFASPPVDVAIVMSAVMIVLGKEETWMSVKKELADPKFVDRIKYFDKDNISQKTLKAIEKYTKKENFQPAHITNISLAAGALCMWVRSLEDYAKALKVVGPKRDKKAYAEEQLKKKIEYLAKLESDYKLLADKLAELDSNYRKTTSEMSSYKKELEDLQTKIDRGDKLITGLSGEKTRWEASLIELDDQFEKLTGDCILAAAFMSYCGPFPSEYRESLMSNWICVVEVEKIPFTKGFDFSEFQAGQAQAREWQMNGLPTDKFSFENGVLVTKGLRWALNIDPQTQANNWIKKMEGDTLVIADFKEQNYMKKIETGVIKGHQVLLQDVEQEMDPVLDNILNKSFVYIGKKKCVKLGDREIEYNDKFRLYITTRMPNPHYTPEVSTKIILVNFTVKESGLEEQCLGIVVKKEQPQLESTKNDVVQRIANNKKQLIDLEDKILRMLQESKVNLLEDVSLIATLQTSKETSDEVKQNLEQAEQTMKRIDDTRETYRPCGRQASILFFVLNDLNKIDPMYQFSLDWYKKLFMKSIDDSREGFQDRIQSIIKTHTLAVFKQACRSLFEKHKILLSLQITIKLQMARKEVNEDEWNFFLRGGQVLDRTGQMPKPPFDWITSQAWDNITELDKTLPETFTGIASAINLNPKEWQRWFLSTRPEPENAQLPGEWETKCEDALKKMIVLRCLRPDRVLFAIRKYVETVMKKEYVEIRPTNIQEIYDESSPDTPIIFVLSPGVDPTDQLKKFAEKLNQKIDSISLGKGQSDKAKNILAEGAKQGNWVFLANCHLSISLLPELESMIDTVLKQNVDPNFRLMLSSSPHPKFPISLLQRSLKVTQEPPRGIKANMLRLFDNMGQFQEVDQDKNYRKSIYGLCFFHALLIERKKFKTLGWNVSYSFNDSDYSVCEDLMAIYMGRHNKEGKPIESYDKRAPIPWQAIQYLIAEANYGGRITDDRDRRLIKVYAKEIFNETLITAEKWKPVGTEELTYGYPADEQNVKNPDQNSLFTPEYFFDEIMNKMEPLDQPVAFGQHVNAEITSQIMDSNELLESILSLQPQKISADGESRESKVLKLLADLKEILPNLVDIVALKHKLRNDENPLNVVLVQELARYNILVNVLLNSLDQLEKGIKGLVLISPDLESIMQSLFENKVPKQWGFAYFSLKPLAVWFRDLNDRYQFFATWAAKLAPYVFQISYFTYPTGFTTSLLQRFSRKPNGAPIDKLEFDFIPMAKPAKDLNEHAKEGAYITGLYLEGAKWNFEKQCLMEPEVMELQVLMPVIHFKPKEKKAKPPQNVYECPCYYYPIREGTIDKDSFMLKIDLKTGDQSPEFWVKRGTALLMSLNA